MKARLLKLEQRNKPSTITTFIQDGYKYIGGKLGFLRVPVEQSAEEWDADTQKHV